MPGRVVDASVVAAWCFREPRATEAYGLIEGMDLYAPELLRYELTNVARKKVIQSPRLMNSVAASLATFLQLPVRWREVDCAAVLELAIESGLTAYDASYLHLSHMLGLPLVTFDDHLKQAAVH